jgi:hypothetical protein
MELLLEFSFPYTSAACTNVCNTSTGFWSGHVTACVSASFRAETSQYAKCQVSERISKCLDGEMTMEEV